MVLLVGDVANLPNASASPCAAASAANCASSAANTPLGSRGTDSLPNASASLAAACCSAMAASSAANMPAVSCAVKVFTGATKAATPDPVVAATADAVGLVPNKPPTVLLKLENKEVTPLPIIPSAESIAGTPVLIVPKPPVANNVLPGNCGIPSLARM